MISQAYRRLHRIKGFVEAELAVWQGSQLPYADTTEKVVRYILDYIDRNINELDEMEEDQ